MVFRLMWISLEKTGMQGATQPYLVGITVVVARWVEIRNVCLFGRTSDVGDEGKREGFGGFYTPREKNGK
jgi:hypothetical protein